MDNPFPPQLDHLWQEKIEVRGFTDMKTRFVEIYKTILILYGYKAVTVVILIASIFIAETIFSEVYMKQVYLLKQKAPSLLGMIGIMILFVLGFMLFFAALTYLLHLMFLRNIIFSPVNYFAAFVDVSCFMVLLIIFSLLVAGVLQRKTYFKYSVEGLRAIRALREIMLYLMIILILIPYSQFRVWTQAK